MGFCTPQIAPENGVKLGHSWTALNAHYAYAHFRTRGSSSVSAVTTWDRIDNFANNDPTERMTGRLAGVGTNLQLPIQSVLNTVIIRLTPLVQLGTLLAHTRCTELLPMIVEQFPFTPAFKYSLLSEAVGLQSTYCICMPGPSYRT